MPTQADYQQWQQQRAASGEDPNDWGAWQGHANAVHGSSVVSSPSTGGYGSGGPAAIPGYGFIPGMWQHEDARAALGQQGRQWDQRFNQIDLPTSQAQIGWGNRQENRADYAQSGYGPGNFDAGSFYDRMIQDNNALRSAGQGQGPGGRLSRQQWQTLAIRQGLSPNEAQRLAGQVYDFLDATGRGPNREELGGMAQGLKIGQAPTLAREQVEGNQSVAMANLTGYLPGASPPSAFQRAQSGVPGGIGVPGGYSSPLATAGQTLGGRAQTLNEIQGIANLTGRINGQDTFEREKYAANLAANPRNFMESLYFNSGAPRQPATTGAAPGANALQASLQQIRDSPAMRALNNQGGSIAAFGQAPEQRSSFQAAQVQPVNPQNPDALVGQGQQVDARAYRNLLPTQRTQVQSMASAAGYDPGDWEEQMRRGTPQAGRASFTTGYRARY